ncbi:MAG: agmatine deiminase [Beggiatoa sp. IS2]|nr:MAG: agmatine deiminase [Beggiatoa sp. IS2]
MNTPTQDGFYMPPEWHLHRCCWMGWPCRPQSWPFELTRAQASYAIVAQTIAQFEPVMMATVPERVTEAVQSCPSPIQVVTLPMDDAWLRDMGPTFIVNDQKNLAAIDWQFNAWGGSHPDHAQDVAFAQSMLAYTQIRRYVAPLILEGGAIHVDGEGTLLTTEQCLLNPNRNPHLTRRDIEKLLSDYLGVKQIIWLGQGLQEDETSGHIDNLACFVRPRVVVALNSQDPQDGNYLALQDNLQRLRQATDAKGRQLEVIEIEQPAHREDAQGLRLSLSYLNFYIANGGIIMPIFNDPADEAAIKTLTQLFPERQVVTVPALDLIHGGGGIHCITQQQPLP